MKKIEQYPPLLTFFGGLLLGNWLAIGRDSAQGKNATAARIHAALLRGGQLDGTEMPSHRRLRFDRAVKRYNAAKTNCRYDVNTSTVIFAPGAREEIDASLQVLLRLTRWH